MAENIAVILRFQRVVQCRDTTTPLNVKLEIFVVNLRLPLQKMKHQIPGSSPLDLVNGYFEYFDT